MYYIIFFIVYSEYSCVLSILCSIHLTMRKNYSNERIYIRYIYPFYTFLYILFCTFLYTLFHILSCPLYTTLHYQEEITRINEYILYFLYFYVYIYYIQFFILYSILFYIFYSIYFHVLSILRSIHFTIRKKLLE